ncbi:MAG: hypothetical protein A2V86_03185 [Deltaproteobacteria bacterium RBG_16_49_23]|nr:MAG: hypothetical protein A2V86_03185 [Deltaproteobacteria bacterium RBG_16_49_23]
MAHPTPTPACAEASAGRPTLPPAFAEAPALRKASGGGASRRQAEEEGNRYGPPNEREGNPHVPPPSRGRSGGGWGIYQGAPCVQRPYLWVRISLAKGG